ncbi:hypothetical protein [Devosia ginsengisoli]|uniref:hypothetical protein n=1 Tax=Devosia ginsengisoli TaxID=400770 RepID=UPI0026F124F3|nr:hypothetical protein [Devosia ginsengisoli]MCR6673359.1 hypothetical protein [Devosia ginsengisoli]
MTFQDYHARAELYLGSDRHAAIEQGGRSFATAAQAIRFALEEAAPVSLHGAMLKVGGTTFGRDDLVALYHSPAFPLPRKRDSKRERLRRTRHYRGNTYAPAHAAAGQQAAMA